MSNIESKIQFLLDLEEIKKLWAQYAYCVDTYDTEAWANLFTEDGVFDCDIMGVFQGRKAIRDFQLLPFTVHYLTNPIIDIDADGQSAQGKWLLLEPCSVALSEGAKPEPIWGMARYEDDYVKVDGAWKFKVVRLRSYTWTPYHKGWEEVRNAMES